MALSAAFREVLAVYWTDTCQLDWRGHFPSILGFPATTPDPDLEGLKDLVQRSYQGCFLAGLQACVNGNRTSIDFPFFTADRQTLWIAIRVAPLDGGGYAIAFSDCHERHERAEQDSKACRNDMAASIASGIAHEFNNQLTPIRGFLEMSMEELGPSHPIRSDLQVVLQQIDECAELIEHIQAYGQKRILQRQDTKLATLAPAQIQNQIRKLGPNRVAILERIEDNLPLVNVDSDAIRRALGHLVANSVTAVRGNGTIQLSMRRVDASVVPPRDGMCSKSRHFLEICIEDDGEGIARKWLNHVTEPFFTTHSRASARGLGLSLVEGVVHQHGGVLDIHSIEGTGTWVRMFLPAVEADECPEAPAEENVETQADSPTAMGRVLVADDEPVVRQLVAKVLRAEGWTVDEVGNYDEVQMAVVQNPAAYNLLLLDVNMPGDRAEDVVTSIRETGCHACVLFLTGMVHEDRLHSLAAMAQASYVLKPFSIPQLMQKVDQFLAEAV